MSLEFALNATAPAAANVDCVVVGAFGDGSLTPAAQALDAASGGRIAALAKGGDVSGKTGRTALLHAGWWTSLASPDSDLASTWDSLVRTHP